MKRSEVVLGETYYCNIGADLCPVIVVGETTNWDGKKPLFLVRRPGDMAVLPKARSAAALRKENKKLF